MSAKEVEFEIEARDPAKARQSRQRELDQLVGTRQARFQRQKKSKTKGNHDNARPKRLAFKDHDKEFDKSPQGRVEVLPPGKVKNNTK